MTRTKQQEDEKCADASGDARLKPEPPLWQIGVPFLVTLFALIALVIFIYGFCAVRSR